MKEVKEGSVGVAYAVKACKPDVMAMYPITPSTHIPEKIAQFAADGELDSKIITVDSEFSAASACVGAAATGARAFTASSSQGIALMHEVIYAMAGARLPMVMVAVNRALAPCNIWNDHQDTMAERDAGWIQLFCETNQEALDTVPQAYKIAEDERVLLPAMVCMDGFILSHTYEVLDIPNEKDVQAFLPPYAPKHAYLDPKKPMSQGPFSYPLPYAAMKYDLNNAITNSKEVIKEVHDEYAKKFGRKYGNGLVEEYKNDRPMTIIALGAVCGTIREVIDERDDIGLLKIRSYRPFPKEEVMKTLEGKENVIVFDKNVSLGTHRGACYEDVRDTLYDAKDKPRVNNAIGGIGGTDVTTKNIHSLIDKLKNKTSELVFLGGDPNE